VDLLLGCGFDRKTATEIAAKATPEIVREQIRLLEYRAPSRSRLGMLRRAIEENWPALVGVGAEVVVEADLPPEARARRVIAAAGSGRYPADVTQAAREYLQATDAALVAEVGCEEWAVRVRRRWEEYCGATESGAA
jgi:hypothetical protein